MKARDPYAKKVCVKLDTYEKNLLCTALRLAFCSGCAVKVKCPVKSLLEKLGGKCVLEEENQSRSDKND